MLTFPEMSARDEVPPSRQVAAIIEAAIRSGEFRPGSAIPSENDLMQMTGLGRKSVRKAVRILRDDGLVRTVATRGSYVRDDIPPGPPPG